ncbi:ferrous iron transport protein A [Vicingaceae bacterium]|nr:ferrous iron transport protein A [Vicingaceae bacterium]MDB4082981.1 ferrous iron transport protein A [Vicingaceae bacterium]MDB9963747.1 ferrous iron transport protein A [Vicingaceae bacterium]MDC1450910.1 ferrous iron transport protein A [Vicingaceae bacterium]
MKSSLADYKVGDRVILKEVLDAQLTIQLYSMGCVLGEELLIERKAPFGDPIIISVEDSFISLRKGDAQKMQVILSD